MPNSAKSMSLWKEKVVEFYSFDIPQESFHLGASFYEVVSFLVMACTGNFTYAQKLH